MEPVAIPSLQERGTVTEAFAEVAHAKPDRPKLVPLFEHAAVSVPIHKPMMKRAARRSDPNQLTFLL